MNHPAVLSFVCGFASLSLEILWVRLYAFARFSTPAAFGIVLAAYLFGIALGATAGGRACRGQVDDARLWRVSAVALLVSAVLSALLPALFATLFRLDVVNPLLDLLVIALASSALAYVFPIAHHLGTRHHKHRQGRRFSIVYTANVTGAALGPLFTGYLLLDTVSLQTAFLLAGAFQAAAGAALLAVNPGLASNRGLVAAGIAGAAALALAAGMGDPHELVQQLRARDHRAVTVVENPHGIITIFPGPRGDDTVLGGNVYDGSTNLDADRNTNALQRPLLMAALHPAPKRVLMVGLSIGTWLAVVREFPGVESIDVVEINPGYLQAAEAYAPQAAAIRDPRVSIHVDDARRWLKHHADRRYDLVIMNTSFHWRANISLLLSREMLTLIRSHMAPGAVMAFNATGSGDAFATAAGVFSHAYRYLNFVYSADFDFRPRKDTQRTRDVYAAMRIGDRPLFAPGSLMIERFIASPFVELSQDQLAMRAAPFEEVTDDNMITEFKNGRVLFYLSDIFSF